LRPWAGFNPSLARELLITGGMMPNKKVAAPSFEHHVLTLRSELYGLALRYTHNERDAEDLVQETLLKAFVAWKSFVPRGSCRSWCYRILTNTFITGYRRRTTELKAAQLESEELRCLTSAASRRAAENPELNVVREQFGDEVLAAMDELSGEFREVLELHYLQGRSYRDIARITRSPMGTVMSRLHRARRSLRSRLDSYAPTVGINVAVPLAA
jgi:RNA polymerase sigma-70 factor (ECF subfamily)